VTQAEVVSNLTNVANQGLRPWPPPSPHSFSGIDVTQNFTCCALCFGRCTAMYWEVYDRVNVTAFLHNYSFDYARTEFSTGVRCLFRWLTSGWNVAENSLQI